MDPMWLVSIKDDFGKVVYKERWKFEKVTDKVEVIPVPVTLGELEAIKFESENVNHPQHYNQGKYEVIEVIEDWNLGFNLGNTVKYIGRAGHKDNKLEDLKKAKWYLEREIQNLEAEWNKDMEF